MLDLKIETFIKVVELKSYTLAAEALHMTQPAVSQHIKKLENYYGCQLIDSRGRGVRLTESGELLYQYIALLHANEVQFEQRLKQLSPPLRIGATLSIADYYLPRLLIKSKIWTRESMNITVGNTSHLVEMLQKSTLDCAFIEGIFDVSLFETRAFAEVPFLPIASKKHPLAGKKIDLKELHGYPLILREQGSGNRELLLSYLHQNNDSIQSFKQVMEMGSFMLMKQMVAHTDAVSFMYEAVAQKEIENGELCVLDLQNYRLTHPLHFIYRKGSLEQSRYNTFYEACCEQGF